MQWQLPTLWVFLKLNMKFWIKYGTIIRGLTVELNGKCASVSDRKAQTKSIYIILLKSREGEEEKY